MKWQPVICVSVFTHTHIPSVQVPTEDRKGHQIPVLELQAAVSSQTWGLGRKLKSPVRTSGAFTPEPLSSLISHSPHTHLNIQCCSSLHGRERMLELEMWGRATENCSCDDLNLLIHKKGKKSCTHMICGCLVAVNMQLISTALSHMCG